VFAELLSRLGDVQQLDVVSGRCTLDRVHTCAVQRLIQRHLVFSPQPLLPQQLLHSAKTPTPNEPA
jgi:hypothetical protein